MKRTDLSNWASRKIWERGEHMNQRASMLVRKIRRLYGNPMSSSEMIDCHVKLDVEGQYGGGQI